MALFGGVVAAAFGGIAPPTRAEDVATREEVVAREAPGKAEAGIAVLRGNERVQLLRDRDGWSEILLTDGRRAWVPTADLVHSESPKASATPVPTVVTTPDPPSRADPVPAVQASLVVEITRLRAVVDDLETRRHVDLPPGVSQQGPVTEIALVGSGVAFLVGVFAGAAWQRRRTRRERSLRF